MSQRDDDGKHGRNALGKLSGVAPNALPPPHAGPLDDAAIPPTIAGDTMRMAPSKMLVKDAMNTRIATISPADTAQSAARLMAENKTAELIVQVPGVGTAIGLISDRDILTIVVAAGLDSATPVAEFMCICSDFCGETDELDATIEKMKREGLNRLVVLDDDHLPCGVLNAAQLVSQQEEGRGNFQR